MSCTSLCRTTSWLSKYTNAMSGIFESTPLTFTRPGMLPAGQVDLGDVAGDDHLGPEAQAGEEHLHLLGRGVLGLVQDDERVVEGPAPHVGEGSHLDGAPLQVVGQPFAVHHVVEGIEQGAQVGIDLLHQSPGQKAQLLARLHRRPGENDAGHVAGQKERAVAMAMAR